MGYISKLQEADYGKDCTIDSMQQYLRLDCIEITGIAILPLDNPKQLVQKLGLLIGVTISEAGQGINSPQTYKEGEKPSYSKVCAKR